MKDLSVVEQWQIRHQQTLPVLMLDTQAILLESRRLQGGRRLDEVDSMTHVRIIGLIREIYFDSELSTQVKYLMSMDDDDG